MGKRTKDDDQDFANPFASPARTDRRRQTARPPWSELDAELARLG